MTIDDSDKVDGLGIDKAAQEVVLLISDHLSWRDEADHFSKLETKIGAYLDFIRSGQLLESLPHAAGMPVRIKLVHEHKPNPSAERILATVRDQLQELEVLFSHEVIPGTY